MKRVDDTQLTRALVHELRKDDKPSGIKDEVNHPQHYTAHPSGVECITVAGHFNFNLGNTIKYIWRAGLKCGVLTDLKKTRFYLDREISRLEKVEKHG